MKSAAALSCLLALACSSPDAPRTASSSAGAAAVEGAAAASGAAGNGATAIAGTAGGGFSSAAAGSAGFTSGSGGQQLVVAGSGGAASEAGSGGASGAAGSPELLAIAAGLDGFRWEFPCAGSVFVTDAACSYDLMSWKNAGGTVDQSNGVQAELTRTFGGATDTLYTVTLRFRGVAEGNMYKHDDGMLDAEMTTGPHFHIGGTVHEHFQVYSLAVSEPPQLFYLNAFHELVTPLAVDYTATIQVRGGATLTFGMADTNSACFANSKQVVVAELPPAPNPFNGQFIQADVVSIAPAP